MNAYLVDALREIMQALQKRLEVHEGDVVALFRRVETGELRMPEVLSFQEIEYALALFGWVASVGPRKILVNIQPLLLKPKTLNGDIALGVFFNDPAFAGSPPIPCDCIDKRTLIRLTVLIVSYIFYDEFHYPQPEAGVYDIAVNPFQKLKWLYRYWFNQLEVAEKYSGLEAVFSAQNLHHLSIKVPEVTGLASLSISCAGDLLAVDALTPENTSHLFDDIVDFYSTTDIVSANLESTVDDSKEVGRTQSSGQPAQMNTSKKMFNKFIAEAKINFFSTATNHSMDWGDDSVVATLDVLKKSKALYAGTAASKAEQDDIVIYEKNGIRVALLSFTMDLNGYKTPIDKSYLVNEVRFNDVDPAPDYSLIKRQVKEAKDKGVNWIIAYCHWGWEFEMYPHVNVRQAAHDIIECGVDTILGNHAHVSQPSELISRADKQDALVVYSFGDFVSYHPESRNSKISYIIKFDIVEVKLALPDVHDSETKGICLNTYELLGLDALPIYIVNEKLADGRFNCRVVKFYDVLENPDGYGLTEMEKTQLPHLRDKVWKDILSPLSSISRQTR
ncbi:CapA family protein [Pseudomonas sp. TH49]|uniref:CapA family protein n=1 Tax=Pseudomonas sp. TH49 TaxID=2796413 RepID=UPI0019129049|nr:CapA family protein [Pseudomonas sp. TH49]MBK5344715.1 CapA family protein [Pseudomonas sp. TH49]